MVSAGIAGLSSGHDDPPLAEIDEALRRHPDQVLGLAYFKSEAADRVAMKYLTDGDRVEYQRVRDESSPP